MASRTTTPANPTLQGTTDDASRGGLFARSNVANPVSGADINGTPINDATVTFAAGDNVTINGGTSAAVTLNQATDQTITIASTATGGGVAPSPANNATVNLTTSGGITGGGSFTLDQATDATLNFSVDSSTLPVPDLQTLTFTGASTGTYNGSTALTVDIPTGTAASVQVNNTTVADADFTDTASVLYTTATGGVINAEARPQWTGNTNRGGETGNVNISRLILDASTGLILQAVDAASGVYRLAIQGTAPPAPTPSGSTTRTTAMGGSALVLPTPPTVAVTASDGMVTNVVSRITGMPDGTTTMVSVSGTTTIAPDMMSASVTFPASTTGGGSTDYSEPGTYTVTTETTTDNPNTAPVTMTTTETFTRFVPYYTVFRSSAPTTLAHLMAGDESTAGYDNAAGATWPSAGGGGAYIATTVLTNTAINRCTSGMGAFTTLLNVRSVGTILVPDAGGINLTYHVFQVAGVTPGLSCRDFREA